MASSDYDQSVPIMTRLTILREAIRSGNAEAITWRYLGGGTQQWLREIATDERVAPPSLICILETLLECWDQDGHVVLCAATLLKMGILRADPLRPGTPLRGERHRAIWIFEEIALFKPHLSFSAAAHNWQLLDWMSNNPTAVSHWGENVVSRKKYAGAEFSVEQRTRNLFRKACLRLAWLVSAFCLQESHEFLLLNSRNSSAVMSEAAQYGLRIESNRIRNAAARKLRDAENEN